MAQQVKIILTDDIDGGEATETVRFGLDGRDFEIDLSEANATKIRKALEPYVDVARKAGKGNKGASNGTPRPKSDKERMNNIRSWAKENNMETSSRGRIKAEVVEAYEKANPGA